MFLFSQIPNRARPDGIAPLRSWVAGLAVVPPSPDPQPVQTFGHASLWPDVRPAFNPEEEAEELAILLCLIAARGRSGGPK
jgi:hypothetical protein